MGKHPKILCAMAFQASLGQAPETNEDLTHAALKRPDL